MRWVWLLLIGLVLLAGCQSTEVDYTCLDCNVIFILIDALRADHLPCYGYERNTAPNICEFANKSMLFENAIASSSWTKPSMGSLFTSKHPHQLGGLKKLNSTLPEDSITLSKILQDAGYYTAGIQTNPILQKKHNFGIGFLEYIQETRFTRNKEQAKNITNLFLQMNKTRQPRFTYLHYMDVHVPYNPPEEFKDLYRGNYSGFLENGTFRVFSRTKLIKHNLTLSEEDKKQLVNLYDAEIRYVDSQLARIFEAIDVNNTIVLILSDHGEEFWDHGAYEHGHTLYDELIHVPFILYIPNISAARIKEQIRLIDVLPMLLYVLNITLPDNATMEGRNFLSSDYAEENAFSESIAEKRGSEKKSIRNAAWKIIIEPDENRTEAYNLRKDPVELNDLSEKNLTIVASLKQILWEALFDKEELVDSETTEFDKHEIEKLKSIGYVV